MVFKNGVKNIQAEAYNGAHTVLCYYCLIFDSGNILAFKHFLHYALSFYSFKILLIGFVCISFWQIVHLSSLSS